MVSITLDEDHPSFVGVPADFVDLEAHLVRGALDTGAQVLISRAVQRSAEQNAAVVQPVEDGKYTDAVPAGVSESADAAGRDELQALGLVHLFDVWVPDCRITLRLRAG